MLERRLRPRKDEESEAEFESDGLDESGSDPDDDQSDEAGSDNDEDKEDEDGSDVSEVLFQSRNVDKHHLTPHSG